MEDKPEDVNRRIKKEDIIAEITRRIGDEERKHPSLDWKKIAAHKIYATYFEEGKISVKVVEGDYCAVCGSTEFWNGNDEENE